MGSGSGLTEIDLKNYDNFVERLNEMANYANERNCILYVDAEQTYM